MRFRLSILTLILSLLCPGLLGAEPLVLHDQMLSTDTTWSGEVLIKGIVVVGKKATLTIEPGTVVRFARLDRNNDGIGDGEIRVLGRIIAVGTMMKNIRFESAAENQQMKDWSYVLLYTSAQKSVIQYCQFSHAFSGVQIHFSKATIKDSLFTGNYEGIRFGRADLTVTNNIFANNETGIRFTRMEGPAVVSQNEIMANKTGIFVAPSGQNIQDFFDPDRGGKAWNTGRLTITANNIHNNSWYDLNLGEKQKWDIDLIGNWWGTTDLAKINEKIFDQKRDPSLGAALIEPIAQAPIQAAGISACE